MKKMWFLAVCSLLHIAAPAQETFFHRDPDQRFTEAKDYVMRQQYSLAWPILKELHADLRPTDLLNESVTASEIEYFYLLTALMQNESAAEAEAKAFMQVTKNTARAQMLGFHLGEYYFRKQDFNEALSMYERSNIAHLSNREISDMKFHQGYAYFTQQRFAQAKPLLNAIRQVTDDPNYAGANYYYGFIAFRDRDYTGALQSFQVVENHPEYEGVVPYYMAQIYYIQGRKAEAIAYAERKVREGKAKHYELELKQLLGHAYFESGQYAKAQPLLEEYVRRSDKVRREDLYELSYSYYQAARYKEAIEGFRQLSGKEDSLSQHSMYLLADAYLKTDQRSNARNAFLFTSVNNSNPTQREIARFNYAKLSHELGYQDEALKGLRSFLTDYPDSRYNEEATDLLVAALTSTNNYREALALLEGLRNPSAATRRLLPRIRYGRATELINDGQVAEAENLLDAALKDPNAGNVVPLVHFWKGELAYRAGRLDEALQHYHAYLNAGAPASGEANERNVKYSLGYAYYRKENYPVARTFFEPLSRTVSLSSDPVTQDAYVRTADTYFMARNFAQARTMYDQVIRYSWAAEDYATYQKAMIAGINNGNEKIAALNTLIRKFPRSPLAADAQMEIADTYLAGQRYREAIPSLLTLINGEGNNALKPQALLKLGIAHYNLNNNDDAVAQFRRITNEYPNAPEAEGALENLRVIYVAQGRPGDYADAARQAGRPLSVSSEDSLTFAAAELQYENGNAATALPAIENYLQRFPEGTYAVNAHYYRAEIYGTRKDWEKALSSYAEVARRAPNPFAEASVLQAGRIQFFERKDYAAAERYYAQLKTIASAQEGRLEAMRGLLRSQYQQQKWTEAVANAQDLLAQKESNADDRSLASMALARAAAAAGQYDAALTHYRNVVGVNKGALAAEARYEIAASWMRLDRLADAEKAAFEVINKSGSYDFWITRAYILLGDIYLKQKDYFNAKATYQSVVENSLNTELKAEAQRKLEEATAAEGAASKIDN